MNALPKSAQPAARVPLVEESVTPRTKSTRTKALDAAS